MSETFSLEDFESIDELLFLFGKMHCAYNESKDKFANMNERIEYLQHENSRLLDENREMKQKLKDKTAEYRKTIFKPEPIGRAHPPRPIQKKKPISMDKYRARFFPGLR